jgi:hypothetical protein
VTTVRPLPRQSSDQKHGLYFQFSDAAPLPGQKRSSFLLSSEKREQQRAYQEPVAESDTNRRRSERPVQTHRGDEDVDDDDVLQCQQYAIMAPKYKTRRPRTSADFAMPRSRTRK